MEEGEESCELNLGIVLDPLLPPQCFPFLTYPPHRTTRSFSNDNRSTVPKSVTDTAIRSCLASGLLQSLGVKTTQIVSVLSSNKVCNIAMSFFHNTYKKFPITCVRGAVCNTTPHPQYMYLHNNTYPPISCVLQSCRCICQVLSRR